MSDIEIDTHGDTEPGRLAAEARRPRVVELQLALARCACTVSFMNTGAHPDDETSAMLAALGRRDGLDLSYACSTRGEGGQNELGTEAGAVLGMLRTAEMERAAEVLDLRLYWLSTSPDDPITDFGFSKSGDETLGRWGHERTLDRFVRIVRTERPDVLCPTFLDVPGQHGHHRAMTALAHETFERAGDAAHATPGLEPWAPKKLCLPAFGGGGSAYDDEVPPPPASFTVEASGVESLTGWSFERIGQQSRALHATQGMGRWVKAGSERDWPLHLAASTVGGEAGLLAGLPATLGELSAHVESCALHPPLARAQEAIDEALDDRYDFAAVLRAAARALAAVRDARKACPAHAAGEVLHRLARKESQLARVVRLAAGVDVRGRPSRATLRPGERTGVSIERRGPDPALGVEVDVAVTLAVASPWALGTDVAADAGPDAKADEPVLVAAADAGPGDPYPDRWLSDAPALPALTVRLAVDGVTSETRVPLEPSPLVLPPCGATLVPDVALMNVRADARAIDARIAHVEPAGASASVDVPDGWGVALSSDRATVTAPPDVAPGTYRLPVRIDGAPASTLHRVAYPHVPARALVVPAALRVAVLDVALPDVRVGYVGGGNDRVGERLRAIGLEVVDIGDAALDSLAAGAGLEGVDTLLVGIFALRTRPALARAMPAVHRWVEGGGHLVTLYHRPRDGWDPERTPVRPLEIGQPSLRHRITDERAAVTHLLPGHPLLNAPNRIGEADWADWHKERGLYFAKRWSDAWLPLLSMADPGEAAQTGALLCAEVGAGRHVHTSLVLHHQLESLVPGAYRLMANLVA